MEKNQNKKQAIQLILMIVLTCVSQVVALYKSRFTAVNFGATDYMDAYNFSLEIATFIFSFVVGGVTTVIIPAYVKKKSPQVINTFITVTYGSIILLTFGILLLRFPLLSLLTGRGGDFSAIASDFLIISFIIQGITAFLAVTSAYYQCENRYNIPKFIVLLANLVVLFVLLSGKVNNIYSYFFLLVFGAVLNLFLDVVFAFRLGFKFKPCFEIKNKEFQQLMMIFLPTLLSSGIYKLQTMVATTIATNLAEGQVTILGYASQIITMVNTVIIGNLTVYIYPKIVAQLKSNNILIYFWDYCILFHGILTLLIAGFINVGFEGMSLLFFGGKFTLSNVQSLYLCATIFIFGQQFNIVRDLVYRYFYANGNTKETFKNSVIVSILNIVLSLSLVGILGVYGIVIGTVLAGLFSLIMIVLRFKKMFGLGLKFKLVLVEMGKNILAMFGTVLLIQWLKSVFVVENSIVAILIYGIMTVIIYVGLVLLLQTKMTKVKL